MSLFCQQKNNLKRSSGYLMILVLVFGSIFMIITSSFISYIVTQNQIVNFRYEQQRATEIAEAGLNYYKWYLAHFPGDVTDGTGLPGPYVHTYKDPEGGDIGEFSLVVASSTYCGSISSIDVSSTGHTYDNPDAKSTVHAKYTRPTVAEYSFISNSGVWYGSGETVIGPVHSNQGVRMDGTHNSIIGSGQSTWSCDSSYGCNPTIPNAPGVYAGAGANSTPGLFVYPVSPIDFAGITLDLSNMKNLAKNNGGIYYGPSGYYGYSVIFNGNGTASIYRVNNTYNYTSYSSAEGWHSGERNAITSTTLLNTVNIDNNCPVMYFEDKVWVKGSINQKVTLAAANLSSGAQTNVVLSGNITYVPSSNAGLLVIAEDDLDLGLDVPNNMTIQGIFIAQNGRFGRNHYDTYYLSNTYDPYVYRTNLNVIGTMVSNMRAVTNWGISGFQSETDSFDRDQIDSPPPFTPETSDVYIFKDWRQDG